VADNLGVSTEAPFSVSDYLEEIAVTLAGEFGRTSQRWIRGEISKDPYEKRHLYLDVKDASGADALIKVKCWESTWSSLRSTLTEQGVALKAGTVINFCGYIDVYKPRGDISVVMTKLDVDSMLGDAARRLQELIARLGAEGVLSANKDRDVAEMPLRVGLIGSPNTEGYKDFLGQLENSGLAFSIVAVPVPVQGDIAPPAIAAAIRQLDARDLDVICMIRGGGSKADLSCFDDERIARAIGASVTPVWTGIGHTGDTSVADLAAHTFAITPTALGAALAARALDAFDRRVRNNAERLGVAAMEVLDDAQQFLTTARREILSTARNRLSVEQRMLRQSATTMLKAARQATQQAGERMNAARQLLAAYDPQRRLAQGWAMVSGPDGTTVRSINDVPIGVVVQIALSDGSLEATISSKKGEGRG
jgi:exodeoxyribonuclease VII large subunit